MCAPATSPAIKALGVAIAAALSGLLWVGLVVGGVQLFHLFTGAR